MTNRFYALTVVLDKDIREDDAEKIINAILMIKHVLSVEGNVSSPETWMAEERAKINIAKKIWDVLHDKIK